MTVLENLLLFAGLGALAASLALVPVGWLVGLPGRRLWWRSRVLRWLGPALQIVPFDDSALQTKLGASFAQLTQGRVGGGRENGMHLYLVTGEQPAGDALAVLQGVSQTQVLASAISLLRLSWRRRRLTVGGALMPAEISGALAVAVSLRRDSKLIDTAEFWPPKLLPGHMTVTDSNSVLAVAAAGWIEHQVVDQTPGPPAREQFLSHDARSWAFFRAGAELNRTSCLNEASDYYEQALAIDPRNIGALIDLAHLRRRDDLFEPAHILASRAHQLIEDRDLAFHWSSQHDPTWYRAQIVLATVDAEWAKAHEDHLEADRLRNWACERAIDTALAAMATRDELAEYFGGDTKAQDAARGAPIGSWTRSCIRRRARRAGWRSQGGFDVDGAAAFYDLLRTTLEPGAMLLAAGNGPRRDNPPPLAVPFVTSTRGGVMKALKHARASVKTELDKKKLAPPGEPDPAVLIEYVERLELKSPRVVYNLACYYSVAASPEADLKDDYLKRASEYLRQSIARTPPLERRSLLDRAGVDPDLDHLRDSDPDAVDRLRHLIPER